MKDYENQDIKLLIRLKGTAFPKLDKIDNNVSQTVINNPDSKPDNKRPQSKNKNQNKIVPPVPSKA